MLSLKPSRLASGTNNGEMWALKVSAFQVFWLQSAQPLFWTSLLCCIELLLLGILYFSHPYFQMFLFAASSALSVSHIALLGASCKDSDSDTEFMSPQPFLQIFLDPSMISQLLHSARQKITRHKTKVHYQHEL